VRPGDRVDLVFINPSAYFDEAAPSSEGLFGYDFHPPLSLMSLAAMVAAHCPRVRWTVLDTAIRYTEAEAVASITAGVRQAGGAPDYHQVAGPRAALAAYVGERRRRVQEQLQRDLGRLDPGLVAIPFHYTAERSRARRVAELARETLPGATVVVGGAHASAVPDRLMGQVPAIDVLVVGEGEHTLVELVHWHRRGARAGELASIPGIVFRDATGLRRTPARPLERDVDRFPHPYRVADDFQLARRRRLVELMPWLPATVGNVVYRDPLAPMATLLTSRGCPFDCVFCSNEVLCHRRVRAHSPDYVRAMARDCVDQLGIGAVYFGDAVFAIDPTRLEALAQGLGPLGLTGYCQTALEVLDERRLDALQRLGIHSVALGIETLNPDIDVGSKGHLTMADRHRRVAGLARRGIKAVGTFIVGLPGETIRSMLRTAVLARRLGLDRASFFPLVAVPGTPIYDRLVATLPAHQRRSVCPWEEEDYLYTLAHSATTLRFLAYLSGALFAGRGLGHTPRHLAALVNIARDELTRR